LLHPLPPFRAKPARKADAARTSRCESGRDSEMSVKARRVPVKVARLPRGPSLKILGRMSSDYA